MAGQRTRGSQTVSSNPVIPLLYRLDVAWRVRRWGMRMRAGRVEVPPGAPHEAEVRRLLVQLRRREITVRQIIRALDRCIARDRAQRRAQRKAERQAQQHVARHGHGAAGETVDDASSSASTREPDMLHEGTVVAPVSIHPPGGFYASSQTVFMACATPSARIRFTLDGSEPSAAARTFSEPFTLDRPAEIRARAVVDGVMGPIASTRYGFRPPPLTASPRPGNHLPPLRVTLESATPDAEIRYTLDGSDPQPVSDTYPTEGIPVRTNAAIKARAFVPGWSPGPLFEAEYRVKLPGWKVLEPTDRSDPVSHEVREYRPGMGGRLMLAASLRGRQHANTGKWREDAFALGLAGGWHIVVVGDGAGSSRLSRVGSATACRAARNALEEALATFALAHSRDGEARTPTPEDLIPLRTILTGAARAAIEALVAAATSRDEPVDTFATTLLIAVYGDCRGQAIVGALQVGDGAVCAATSSGFRSLGEADGGAYSGETRFLTSKGIEHDLERRVRFLVVDDVHALAVMTDGVADDFFPIDDKMPGLLDDVQREAEYWPEAESGLLDWLRYERRGSNDDRTLALVLREGVRGR